MHKCCNRSLFLVESELLPVTNSKCLQLVLNWHTWLYYIKNLLTLSADIHLQTAPSPSSVALTVTPGTSLYFFYRSVSYLLLKTKQILLELLQLSWRFMELHLHKISILVLFVVVLSEVSAGYWGLLIVALVTLPLPYFISILYPIITIYIGLLSVLKTIYQFPIINPDMFNLTTINKTENDAQCYDLVSGIKYLYLVYNVNFATMLHIWTVWKTLIIAYHTIMIPRRTLCVLVCMS